MASLPVSFSVSSGCLSNVVAKSIERVPLTCSVLSQHLSKGDNKCDLRRKLIFIKGAYNVTSSSCRRKIFHANALLNEAPYQMDEKPSGYLFRSEGGSQVTVSVKNENLKYYVHMEVSSFEPGISDGKLVLYWGVFRSDSSSFMPAFETPFVPISLGTYGLELEIESYLVPCYLSFVLKCQPSSRSDTVVIESHRKTNFCVPVGLTSGHSTPLGLSFSSNGLVNFSLFSRTATNVSLCLYKEGSADEPSLEIELDPYVNRTGDIWHLSMSMDSTKEFVRYGFRCKGALTSGRVNKILVDPYAKLITEASGLGELCNAPNFDWAGDVYPGLPMEKLVLYRLNVHRFTIDKSSQISSKFAGTFSGIVKKLDHFKNLGVNAILLEPIFPFDESKGPYYPFHFFSLANIYGPSGECASAISSMKEMVKKMHSSGIEVYLEVVFTHTAEAGALKEIDSFIYYYADKDLGSRNALNCNYPIVQQFILDSLRYWVSEFHIDGFSFVNASYLLRGFHGEYLSRPPLVEAIAFDPLLSKAKIIADFWDPHDVDVINFRFPHWKRWAEMNSKYCCDIRNYLRGESLLSDLATRLCGSGDIFSGGRGPAFSFNYIARNSGLPLVDLVSFSSDDLASELSWNCGEEGATSKMIVLEKRLKQIRNFLFILFVSLGVPVLNMGDEAGQSSGGSPAYGDRTALNWSTLDTVFGMQMMQFISFLCSLRERRHDLFQKRDFFKDENISWHNIDLSLPKWDDPSAKFLAMSLKSEILVGPASSKTSPKGDLYVAFNAGENSENVILPSPPEGMEWLRLVDTALQFPGFFSSEGESMPGIVNYDVKSHSCVLFEAKKLC